MIKASTSQVTTTISKRYFRVYTETGNSYNERTWETLDFKTVSLPTVVPSGTDQVAVIEGEADVGHVSGVTDIRLVGSLVR